RACTQQRARREQLEGQLAVGFLLHRLHERLGPVGDRLMLRGRPQIQLGRDLGSRRRAGGRGGQHGPQNKRSQGWRGHSILLLRSFMGVSHSMRLGSQVAISGKLTSSTTNTRSVARNQKMPLKMVSVRIASPTTPLMTKTFSPTGGVIRATSSHFVMRMPNQIMSRPACSATGRKTGRVSSM